MTTNAPSQSDLALALALADEADRITMDRFAATDLVVSTKPDMTLVSDADQATESALRALLRDARPEDSIIGEEEPDQRGASGRRWVIDPIDGTHNYVRGVPVWATLIGLIDEGEPVVGVVSAPALSRRWWAAKDQGAHTMFALGAPRQIQVSQVSELSSAFFSYSSLSGWEEAGLGRALEDLMQTCWRTRGFGDFWSYMLVAEGVVDLAAEPELALHDMAALVPIVTEAGGQFTSLEGKPGPWGPGAIATNGLLQEQTVEKLGGSFLNAL